MRRGDIERFNEWWFTERVKGKLAPKYKRHTFKDVLKSLEEMTDLRRFGKPQHYTN